MTTIVNTKLGETRGTRRIYLEGAKLAREGYQPGDRYDLALEDARVVIKLHDAGKYMVSKRQRNGTLYPVIDITRAELAELFDGVEIRLQGQIFALPVISGGTEPECPGASVGVYDADHIREHGESVITDLASVPARHVLGRGASSIAGQALSCAA